MRVYVIVLLAFVFCMSSASAATMRVVDDYILVSGKFVQGDAETFASLLKDNPDISEVVLYDSPGGNGTVMQRMSALIRTHKMTTGVAGNCASACAMIFLSGVQRYFTDLVPVGETDLAFHGSYRPDGELASEQRLSMIAGMIADETGGKADPTLVNRWTHFSAPRFLMRFTYPGASASSRPSVFECSGGQRFPTDYSPCTPVTGHDALSMGIITSTQVLHIAH